MNEAPIRIDEPAPHVRRIRIDRPQSLNAINMATFLILEAAFGEAEQDTDVHVILLAGCGGQAFSAGFDIHEMAGFDEAAMKAAFLRRDPFFWQVAHCAKPVVAALEGITFGAGALIAAAADLRMASAALRFKITATSYGAANATWSLPPIVGIPKAKELLYTGCEVDGAEALRIGLVNALVAEDAVPVAAIDMASRIARHPQTGVRGAKALIEAGVGRSLAENCAAEVRWMENSFEARQGGDALFTGFLSKRTREED